VDGGDHTLGRVYGNTEKGYEEHAATVEELKA
jgi:hypothetical protein